MTKLKSPSEKTEGGAMQNIPFSSVWVSDGCTQIIFFRNECTRTLDSLDYLHIRTLKLNDDKTEFIIRENRSGGAMQNILSSFVWVSDSCIQ